MHGFEAVLDRSYYQYSSPPCQLNSQVWPMPRGVPASLGICPRIQGQGPESGEHLRGARLASAAAVCGPAGLQDGLHGAPCDLCARTMYAKPGITHSVLYFCPDLPLLFSASRCCKTHAMWYGRFGNGNLQLASDSLLSQVQSTVCKTETHGNLCKQRCK